MHEKKLATMLALTEFATMAFRIDETKGPGKQGHIVADKLLPTQMFPRLRAQRNVMSNNVPATMFPRLPGP